MRSLPSLEKAAIVDTPIKHVLEASRTGPPISPTLMPTPETLSELP